MSDDILNFSPEGLAARFTILKDNNTINIFIEDDGKEYEYETIFKKLLGSGSKIETIFATGGKLNLIKRFYEFGRLNENRTSNVYIADGDFDRYIGIEMIDDPNFIYLETYNIENYLIDECATCIFAKSILRHQDDEVAKYVNFNRWLDEFLAQAKRLFILYCTIQKYYPEIRNVGESPYRFIDDRTGFFRENAYEAFYSGIREQDPELDTKIAEIDSIYVAINGDNYFNLICGKFLFISLFVRLGRCKVKIDQGALRWTLICNLNLDKLNYIKTRIQNVLSTTKGLVS